MRKSLFFLIPVCVVFCFVACSGNKAPSATSGHENVSGSPAVSPVSTEVTAPVPAPASPSVPAQGTNPLVGTKWQYDGMTIYFKNEKMVFMSGGRASQIAPSGLETPYTLKDGVLEVSLMGAKISGTYDGTALTAEGKPATRLQ